MKKINLRKNFATFCLLVAAVLLWLSPALADSATRYTRFNIHVQAKLGRGGSEVYNASYANYTDPGQGHLVIPAGSRITILKKNRKLFRFRVEEEQKVVDFLFHAPRMQMKVGDYIEKITSPKPVSLAGFSKIDQKGIAAGKAYVGMSRDGVLTALGYPATHRTPSLAASTWVYWTNRYGTIGVDFDARGNVKAIRN